MSNILTVTFADGDIVDQLFMLKVSALRNSDTPTLWRLTEEILKLLLTSAKKESETKWPAGYVSETRLFNVPVDFVSDMPHLLCDKYVVYPYCVNPTIHLFHQRELILDDPIEEVHKFVRSIPVGKVATYGQIADSIDTCRLTARMVGSIMRECPMEVPWHRVVGAGGHLPVGKRSPQLAIKQRELLAIEGVSFRKNGAIDMEMSQYEEY